MILANAYPHCLQGTKRSDVLRTDLDKLSQPVLKELYSIVVEELPSNRAGVKWLPKLQFRTVRDLYLKAHFGVFDPQMAFLPVSLASIKNFLPEPDTGSGAAQEKFTERLREAREHFEESGLFRRIKLDLVGRGHSRVRKIIGFACGEFDRPSEVYSTMEQMGFFLALSKFLDRQRRFPQIACFVQDDSFSGSVGWTRALAQFRVTVINEPQAFLELDQSTAVIAFNPTVPVHEITEDLARPAMMFWPGGDDDADGLSTKDWILEQRRERHVYSVASPHNSKASVNNDATGRTRTRLAYPLCTNTNTTDSPGQCTNAHPRSRRPSLSAKPSSKQWTSDK